MAFKLFFGTGSFTDPTHWYPQGVPVSGDQANVSRGAATASGIVLDNLTIGVAHAESQGIGGSLLLQNVSLGAGLLLNVFTEADTLDFAIGSTLQVQGAIVNQGTITFTGGTQKFTLPTNTTLINSGVINLVGCATQVVATDATGCIVNNGLIRVNAAPSGETQINELGPPITDTGSISVSLNDSLAFGSAVSAGQTVLFNFFTASAGERDQIVAMRPDLIFEPSSSFLEDTVQTAGDVPVYRFFSAADGTHFYTASATEAAGLSPSRFVAEGISFYAPAGSFV